MSSDLLNVVVTCSKQKRFPVSEKLRLGSVAKGTIATRFAEWRSRLVSSRENTCRVADLYGGDHWSTALGFKSKTFEIKLWVASAGYGLLGLEDHVVPYAATFSKPSADSVFNKIPKHEREEASRVWWQNLTKWRITGHCRSLAGLARARPEEGVLIVASEIYLKAMEGDLLKAVGHLDSRSQFSILSTGCKSLGTVSDCLLSGDARLQHLVGGARGSLNTRAAAHLLAGVSGGPSYENLERRMKLMLKGLPEIPKFDREPVTDDAVTEFILSELNLDASLAHTPLLRRFRDGGRACEQSRFRGLYNEVKMRMSEA